MNILVVVDSLYDFDRYERILSGVTHRLGRKACTTEDTYYAFVPRDGEHRIRGLLYSEIMHLTNVSAYDKSYIDSRCREG